MKSAKVLADPATPTAKKVMKYKWLPKNKGLYHECASCGRDFRCDHDPKMPIGTSCHCIDAVASVNGGPLRLYMYCSELCFEEDYGLTPPGDDFITDEGVSEGDFERVHPLLIEAIRHL
jgi:hypothetical protein